MYHPMTLEERKLMMYRDRRVAAAMIFVAGFVAGMMLMLIIIWRIVA